MKQFILFLFFLCYSCFGVSQTKLEQSYFENEDIHVTKTKFKINSYETIIGEIGDYIYVCKKGAAMLKTTLKLSKHHKSGKKVKEKSIPRKRRGYYKRFENYGHYEFEPIRDIYEIIDNKLYHFILDEDKKESARRVWVERIDPMSLKASKPELLFEQKTSADSFEGNRRLNFDLTIKTNSKHISQSVLIVKSDFAIGNNTSIILLNEDKFTPLNFEMKYNYRFDKNAIYFVNNEVKIPFLILENDKPSTLSSLSIDINSGKINHEVIDSNMDLEFLSDYTTKYYSLQLNYIKSSLIVEDTYLSTVLDGTKNYYFNTIFNLKSKLVTSYFFELKAGKNLFLSGTDGEVFKSKFKQFKNKVDAIDFKYSLQHSFINSNGELIIVLLREPHYLMVYHRPEANDISYQAQGDYLIYKMAGYQHSLIGSLDISNLPVHVYPTFHYGTELNQDLVQSFNNSIFFAYSTHNAVGERFAQISKFELETNTLKEIKSIEDTNFNFGKIKGNNEFVNNKGYFLLRNQYGKTFKFDIKLK